MIGNQLLIFFRDRSVKKYDLAQFVDGDMRFGPILKSRDIFNRVQVETGGYGIRWGENVCIDNSVLYAAGELLPLSLDDFKAFTDRCVVDTEAAAKELDCSMQNIDYLVHNEKLQTVKNRDRYKLFLRSEIQKRNWK